MEILILKYRGKNIAWIGQLVKGYPKILSNT